MTPSIAVYFSEDFNLTIPANVEVGTLTCQNVSLPDDSSLNRERELLVSLEAASGLSVDPKRESATVHVIDNEGKFGE